MARLVSSTLMGPRVAFALPRGAAMAYRDSIPSSASQSVLLLHGVGMTADLNWRATYPDLCRQFRVVAPDLPGHGRDIRPWPKFTIDACADHIVALADSLGIDRFIACGYSMGSLVAQQVWRSHPDRVSGLVLGAASRNFLGSTGERMVSSLSPVFAVAAQINPFLHVLRADALGLGYLIDLDAEARAHVHAEMSLTSMATVAAAFTVVRLIDIGSCRVRWRVHLAQLDRRCRRPGGSPGHDEGLRRADQSADETRPRDTACHRHQRGGRSRRVRRDAEAVRRQDIGGVPGRV